MMVDLAGATDLSMSSSPRSNQIPNNAYRPLDDIGHEQKTRLPNWTEEEKNVLIQEVRRRAAVLTTPRAKGMSHLKEKAWEEITAAVNAVQAPGSQLRNAQTCRKKWENLKLYAKKAQKEGRSDVTLSTVSQLIGSDVDLKVLQATLQAVQGTSPSPSPGPIEANSDSLGALFSVLQQQGMNGTLARMLGISNAAPTMGSDEASLSDCSNSVEDGEELRVVKNEILDDTHRRFEGRSSTETNFQERPKPNSSPLSLPPGVSLEPIQKMTVNSPIPRSNLPSYGTPLASNGFHHSHHQVPQRTPQRSSQSPMYSNGVTRSTNPRQNAVVNRLNGLKRHREDDSESEEGFLDKRMFYKEMTKLCGTVQTLLHSMNETQQLKQQILVEKLRLIRLKVQTPDIKETKPPPSPAKDMDVSQELDSQFHPAEQLHSVDDSVNRQSDSEDEELDRDD